MRTPRRAALMASCWGSNTYGATMLLVVHDGEAQGTRHHSFGGFRFVSAGGGVFGVRTQVVTSERGGTGRVSEGYRLYTHDWDQGKRVEYR